MDDVFLHNYATCAHPYDFYSIRYVFASSEKIRKETTQLWLDKFGIRTTILYQSKTYFGESYSLIIMI